MKKLLRKLLVLVFWITVWGLLSVWVGQELLLPSPLAVLEAFSMVRNPTVWNSVGMTLFRSGAAYVLGVVLGALLAALCCVSEIMNDLIHPVMTMVRATPVASFIILALVWLNTSHVPILAGCLMVTPVVFANCCQGIRGTDQKLLEMAKCFHFGRVKTWRHVVIPATMPAFFAACKACVGLCFKATIAAEVIGIPRNAIGSQLYNAKVYLETPALIAWTILIILLSAGIEKLLGMAFERGIRRGRSA